MTGYPTQIVAFETSDRQLFRSEPSAVDHQRRLDAARMATELLESGVSVRRALVESGLVGGDHYPQLDDCFLSTKLIIEHWQCRDQPGYSPLRFDPQARVWCHGDAGSWSGSYGSWVDLRELVRLHENTKERLASAAARVLTGGAA